MSTVDVKQQVNNNKATHDYDLPKYLHGKPFLSSVHFHFSYINSEECLRKKKFYEMPLSGLFLEKVHPVAGPKLCTLLNFGGVGAEECFLSKIKLGILGGVREKKVLVLHREVLVAELWFNTSVNNILVVSRHCLRVCRTFILRYMTLSSCYSC